MYPYPNIEIEEYYNFEFWQKFCVASRNEQVQYAYESNPRVLILNNTGFPTHPHLSHTLF